MINHRLKQLFFAALGLHAATPTARPDVSGYVFLGFNLQPARAGTNARPLVVANDNGGDRRALGTPTNRRSPRLPCKW
jgi:hypothetical protein